MQVWEDLQKIGPGYMVTIFMSMVMDMLFDMYSAMHFARALNLS